MTTAQFTEDIP